MKSVGTNIARMQNMASNRGMVVSVVASRAARLSEEHVAQASEALARRLTEQQARNAPTRIHKGDKA